jgi:uncharacterized protein (DUF58 family)
MILPSALTLRLCALWAVAAVAVSIWPDGLDFWIVASLAFGLALGYDLLSLRFSRMPIEGQRQVPGSLPVGVFHEVRLRLNSTGRKLERLEVYDHHPSGCDRRDLPQSVTIPPGGWAELRYGYCPLGRGNAEFGRIELRRASPLRLWQQRAFCGAPQMLRVYPNFATLTKYALLAIDNRLSQIGVLKRRRRGEGLEFHQLREYRQGDALRQVDWKASARISKLISREYQDERDQQIFFVLDCGRRMAAKDGPLSHFDHVLNAVLLLAYVAIRQGDAVGLTTTGGPPRFLAPRKSAACVNLILNTVYDLEASGKTTDYYSAAVSVMLRLRKRALVVFISNLRDEDDDTVQPALRLLSRRHLVLFANLREHILGDALAAPVTSFDDAVTLAAAADFWRARSAALKRIERCGAITLDAEPGKLPILLVNRYLDIKSGGVL